MSPSSGSLIRSRLASRSRLIVTLAFVLLSIAIVSTRPKGVHFSPDANAKFLQMLAIRLDGGLKLDVPYVGRSYDPELRAVADLREDGVLGSSGETSSTTWRLLSSPHPTSLIGERADEEGSRGKVKKPVNARDSLIPGLPSSSSLSPMREAEEGSDNGYNAEQERARAIEILRQNKEGS